MVVAAFKDSDAFSAFAPVRLFSPPGLERCFWLRTLWARIILRQPSPSLYICELQTNKADRYKSSVFQWKCRHRCGGDLGKLSVRLTYACTPNSNCATHKTISQSESGYYRDLWRPLAYLRPAQQCPSDWRIFIAQGRDAADVALTHTFGPGTLSEFRVWADEASVTVKFSLPKSVT